MRRVGVIAGFAVLIGAFGISSYMRKLKQPPPEMPTFQAVAKAAVQMSNPQSIAINVPVQGQLVAFNKIEIYTEVTGTLQPTQRPFKVGTYFPSGSTIIQIDDTEAQLSLFSQKSNLLNALAQMMPELKIDYPESYGQWKTYLDQFEIEAPLAGLPTPLNQQEKYFLASRNIFSQYFTIKSAEERLEKYTLYAPFSGVITQTSINSGALVRAGQKLGDLMNTNTFELEASIPLGDLKYVKKGDDVKLMSEDLNQSFEGTVVRISDQVNATTQTIMVFIRVDGKDLKEGMYLKGNIETIPVEDAIEIPRNLLVDGNHIFNVVDSALQLMPVEVVDYHEDKAVIKGVAPGQMILINSLPGAFEGMRVSPVKQ
jgi:multidrug efflux pump subunit AcrA (membrane-fusion protein)